MPGVAALWRLPITGYVSDAVDLSHCMQLPLAPANTCSSPAFPTVPEPLELLEVKEVHSTAVSRSAPTFGLLGRPRRCQQLYR